MSEFPAEPAFDDVVRFSLEEEWPHPRDLGIRYPASFQGIVGSRRVRKGKSGRNWFAVDVYIRSGHYAGLTGTLPCPIDPKSKRIGQLMQACYGVPVGTLGITLDNLTAALCDKTLHGAVELRRSNVEPHPLTLYVVEIDG